MTVSVTTAVKKYTGDGSTTAFPTVFVFNTSADIEVIERVIATGVETTKTLTTHYTVSGGGGSGAEPATGTVTAVSAPASTVEWHIRRVVAETQSTDLPTAGAFPSAAVETVLDRLTMMVQQHTEELGRDLAFPKTDDSSLDPTIPNSVDRASKYLSFDANGNPTASLGTSAVEGTWTPAFTFSTAGDLVATASTALGVYNKIDSLVFCEFTLLLSTFTHSTASGSALITGLPFTNSSSAIFGGGDLEWQGITKANYTDLTLRVLNDNTALLMMSGSGQATGAVTSSDMPTGGTVEFRGSLTYTTAE